MNKRILLAAWLLMFSTTYLLAQSYFNYGPDGKNYYDLSQDKILVKFEKDLTTGQKREIISKEAALQPMTEESMLPSPKVAIIKVQPGASSSEILAAIDRLNNNGKVVYANPFLVFADGTEQGIQDRFIVGLKDQSSAEKLAEIAEQTGTSILKQNEFDASMYIMVTDKNSQGNALEMANYFHETGLFKYAEPDFLLLLKKFSTNDTYLGYQWSLNNTGSSIQYSGTAGADMDVFNAWTVTTGSSNIKVAILDEGVDLNHPDLVANMEPGYDATGQGSGGNPQNDDAHGTACAGIVAAVGNNNLGVAGVAYGARIVPIRIAYDNGSGGWVTSNSWIANATNWAWQNGDADILSNSWGGGGSSSSINSAISGAVNSGRVGLGAPVLFAAGNDNGSVSYPATNNSTISVTAMSMCYERKSPSSCDGETWWGSNYGTNTDVSAPGVKIFTTDISGGDGYSSGDYVSTFNGTSSATPNAAGVMALILSANPNLTEDQARDALETTCRKVGGYSYGNNGAQPNGTWSTELGYGLIDAYAAVQAVAPQVSDDAGISGISGASGSICGTSISPVLTLNNYGNNTLTSVTINYQLDGGAVNTLNWTGSLSSASSTNVSLPTLSVASGSHTFDAYTSNPNGNTDNNTANDGQSTTFSSATNAVTLTLVLDNYGSETTWEVRDGSSNVVAGGGPYSNGTNGTTVTSNFCVADGCFDFVINDSYGDGICCGYGNGSYILTEDNSGNTLASGGAFNYTETTNFCLSSTPPVTATSSSTDVSCNGGSDGTASVSASGGQAPYTYAWSNGGSTASLSGLSAGSYSYTVTSNDGGSATGSVIINQPLAVNASASASNANCNGGSNGSVSANASGGTSPYSYAWSNGANNATVNGLSAGTYSVTVTDANGCQATASANVTQPSSLSASANGSGASCNGGSDGSASASASGGTAPYSYTWSNGSNNQTANGLSAGTYDVTVTDANGCQATASATVSEPSALALSTSSTDENCNGSNDGSASSSVSGGTAPYSYVWSNGSTSANLSGIGAGSYSLTVTDANGCQASSSTSVNAGASVNASASGNDVSCNGGSDGSASVSASGGSAPYSYSWSNGGSTANIGGLSAGTYGVTVTDANGCQTSVSTNVGEPSALNANASSTDASCNGSNDGKVNSSVSGGTAPYSYNWSNGSTSDNQSGLAPGSYGLTVTDANGCQATATTSVGEPSALSASAGGTDVSCNGGNDGTASASAAGGTSPYSYSWSNGSNSQNLSGLSAGTFSVTVTDNSGCQATASVALSEPNALAMGLSSTNESCGGSNDGSVTSTVFGGTTPYSYAWSNGSSSANLSGVGAGTYSLTVTDANGCASSSSTSVGQGISISLNASSSDASCSGGNDGSASVNVTSGGTAPYSYAWSNGATGSNNSGLSAGTYGVTVTDANGCQTTSSASVGEPSAVNASASGSDVSCNGAGDGSASANANGGTPPYSYAWSNGSNSQNLSGLGAGTYSVTVTDANGCQATASTSVSEPSALSAAAVGNDATCNGQANGSVNLSVSGGTSPYSYAWSNGSSSSLLVSVGAGTYSVTVTDGNGCQATISASVGEPFALTVRVLATDASCNGGSDATASASAGGGTAPYTYNWSNGASGANASSLSAGTYSVTVTDGNGCQVTASATVGQPSALAVSTSSTEESCAGADGTATASAGGGTGAYSYSWSNGGSTASLSGLAAGSYSVTVTDANGCQATSSTTVSAENCNTGIAFETGSVNANDGWQTVSLSNNYSSMVVVATPVLPNSGTAPVVTRIRNASGNSFDLRVQTTTGATAGTYEVQYFVVEEGAYNVVDHGVKMEAVKANSVLTARKSGWGNRETRSYLNSYTNPVVLGQVMTYNDADWSVFWASTASSQKVIPSATSFAAGKNVGEDPNTTRADETIGYVVFEEGVGSINGTPFSAGTSANNVKGVDNTSSGYSVPTGLAATTGACLSAAGMNGGNGGWPVLYGGSSYGGSDLKAAFDEDEARDSERKHTNEEIAFVAFGATGTKRSTLDDEVSAIKENTNTTKLQNVKMYPNPATYQVTMEFDATSELETNLMVHSLTGQMILLKEISAMEGANKHVINTGDFVPGVYIVTLVSGEAMVSKKLIITGR